MKTKQLLLILLSALLPLAAWADIWQDPETKVNYEYTVGKSEASVAAGDKSIFSGQRISPVGRCRLIKNKVLPVCT